MMRIGGIVSGLDTEQIVRDLMRIERMKTDRLFQQRQTMTWQKEQFRDIINGVRRFRDDYFNIARPETNLMSLATLKKMTATCDNDAVSVTASSQALSGESTFQVMQSAAAAKAVASAVTSGSGEGARLSLSDTMQAVSDKLGAGTPLQFNEEGRFTVTINETEIVIAKTDTLSSVINKINTSSANLQAHYSTFSDTFTLTAKNTGAGYITTDDGGNFFSALGLAVDEGNIGTAGRDAEFEINGHAGTRAENIFTIDGITYSINGSINEATEIMTVTTAVDPDAIFGVIEKFVEDYNSLLDMVNGRLKEEKFKDFLPLTDEQKDAMKDRDIELWEEKAQSGLLKGDPALETMLRDMRVAIYEMVGDFHLSEIGIETSNNYRDQGKLTLKDGGNTLRQAITANPDKVADLFARRSDIAYSPNLTSAQREQRYSESGIAQRLSDILNDNIRTTRDNQGRKGTLLEKAGIQGDITEFNNLIDRQISDLNKRMDRMNEILDRKESQYYRQFSAMEKSLQQLYSQGDWLMTQLDQGWGKR